MNHLNKNIQEVLLAPLTSWQIWWKPCVEMMSGLHLKWEMKLHLKQLNDFVDQM